MGNDLGVSRYSDGLSVLDRTNEFGQSRLRLGSLNLTHASFQPAIPPPPKNARTSRLLPSNLGMACTHQPLRQNHRRLGQWHVSIPRSGNLAAMDSLGGSHVSDTIGGEATFQFRRSRVVFQPLGQFSAVSCLVHLTSSCSFARLWSSSFCCLFCLKRKSCRLIWVCKGGRCITQATHDGATRRRTRSLSHCLTADSPSSSRRKDRNCSSLSHTMYEAGRYGVPFDPPYSIISRQPDTRTTTRHPTQALVVLQALTAS